MVLNRQTASVGAKSGRADHADIETRSGNVRTGPIRHSIVTLGAPGMTQTCPGIVYLPLSVVTLAGRRDLLIVTTAPGSSEPCLPAESNGPSGYFSLQRSVSYEGP
jgi:hypothetical protein